MCLENELTVKINENAAGETLNDISSSFQDNENMNLFNFGKFYFLILTKSMCIVKLPLFLVKLFQILY